MTKADHVLLCLMHTMTKPGDPMTDDQVEDFFEMILKQLTERKTKGKQNV